MNFLYGRGGLPFWEQEEILIREQMIQRLYETISKTLYELNPAWSFLRVEGPVITPKQYISSAYDSNDMFQVLPNLGGVDHILRAETTASSYAYMQYLIKSGKHRFPLCVWQVGKSYRVEPTDGATASNLRYNEFYQCEFQCAYKVGTKADYRAAIMPKLANVMRRITGSSEVRIVKSDRLPVYSELTEDVELPYSHEETITKWKEVCSVSTRTDFSDKDVRVLEIAVGLDRLVAIEGCLT